MSEMAHGRSVLVVGGGSGMVDRQIYGKGQNVSMRLPYDVWWEGARADVWCLGRVCGMVPLSMTECASRGDIDYAMELFVDGVTHRVSNEAVVRC
jgi:hypothetical protein